MRIFLLRPDEANIANPDSGGARHFRGFSFTAAAEAQCWMIPESVLGPFPASIPSIRAPAKERLSLGLELLPMFWGAEGPTTGEELFRFFRPLFHVYLQCTFNGFSMFFMLQYSCMLSLTITSHSTF